MSPNPIMILPFGLLLALIALGPLFMANWWSRQYARVWFAYDDAVADTPDPTHDWLDQSLRQVDQRDFADGTHLVLYLTGAAP